ncbi:MAG: hypothetical protein RBS56_04835 [Candidatus Gracilibacteria bacterium]|jgi:hypothetical protein|nr:hypothetical protein [Candidatus Gracilibacteria bacterium]
MTLKQIPGEYLAKVSPIKKRKSILLKIRNRLSANKTQSGKLVLKKACFSLMNFLSNEGHMSISDLNELIRNLERSIMVVQAGKKRLVEKTGRKK